MKNILWFCNRPIDEIPDKRDGTWFTAMAKALIETDEIKLSVISQGKVKSVLKNNLKNVHQWIIPQIPLGIYNSIPKKFLVTIHNIIEDVNPDLIHIWGTENYWGLFTARGLINVPTVLDIQGLKFVYANVYFGGISSLILAKYLGPAEILRLTKSIIFGKTRFQRWGKLEKEMICYHKYISTQSEFVRTHIKALNPDAHIYETGIMLREEFYRALPWTFDNSFNSNRPSVFASSAFAFPYKGLHVLIKSIAILKQKYPKITLNLAGDIRKKGIRKNCYVRFLEKEINSFGLEDNIIFLGPLNANDIIHQIYKSSVVVVPSFIETYSLALAEAMYLGVPVVASYAGAMPELANNGESALFFPIGDAVSCAMQIDKILSNHSLAKKLSENARIIGLVRNNKDLVLKKQLEIYNDILKKEYKNKVLN